VQRTNDLRGKRVVEAPCTGVGRTFELPVREVSAKPGADIFLSVSREQIASILQASFEAKQNREVETTEAVCAARRYLGEEGGVNASNDVPARRRRNGPRDAGAPQANTDGHVGETRALPKQTRTGTSAAPERRRLVGRTAGVPPAIAA
jgi:hypothetical protein